MISVIAALRARSDLEIELERAEFYRALPPERVANVRSLLVEKRFSRQQVLFFEGEPATAVWTVRRGEVRLYKSSPGARLTTLESLHPGEVFGALPALEDETYAASAEAVTDGSAWCLPRAVFQKLLEQEPTLNAEILKIISRRLREAHERLRSFAHDPAPARVAAALVRAVQGGEARVTRRALAEAAGTTVETAIRVLRRLEGEGIIRGEVGRVQVLDEASLRRAAGGV